MALATIYSMTFKDVEEITWAVNFQRDYGVMEPVPILEEVTPADNPLTITWNGSEKYQPIVGSSVDFTMLYDDNLCHLFTDISQDVYVIVYRDSNIIWKGFLIPGQYHRRFNEPKHFITITATDGLGDLKNIKFEDGSGDPYFLQDDELQVLSDCLDKTGMTLSVHSAINIYEDNHTATTATTPLNQTYLYPEMYWDEQTDERSNCDQPISDILFKYGATIRQSVGIWYILRPNSFSLDTIYYRTSVSGTTTGSDSYTSYNSIDTNNYYINQDQEITKLPGVGRCEVTQNPPRRSNILKNGSFRTFTKTGLTVDYWTNTNSPSWAMTDDVLRMSNNESSSVPTAYITCLQNISQANTIRLRFDYDPAYTGTPTYNSLYLYIIFGGKYLTTSGWSSSALPYIIPITSTAAATADINFPVFYSGSNSFPTGEDLYIRIYEYYNETAQGTPWDNYIEFSNMRLEIDSSEAYYNVFTYDNPLDILYIKKITMSAGDTFNFPLDDEYFINSYAAGRSSQTQYWSIYGDPTASATISEVLSRQTVEGYRKSLDVLRGSIRSARTDFSHTALEDSNFNDDYGFPKRFFPNGISYNAHRNEWSGEWVECPATYTDEEMEWDSQEAGGDGSITANKLEISAWTSDTFYYAAFDSFTVVAGETVRIVVNLEDDGSSDLPGVYIDGGTSETRAWGLNYYTFNYTSAGTHTLSLGNGVGSTINMTCTVDHYSITGI